MIEDLLQLHQVDETGRRIRELQMERAQIPPLRRLSDLVALIESHAGLAARRLRGDASLEPRRLAVKANAAEIQARTRASAAEWQGAADAWRALVAAVESGAIGQADCERRHAALARQYRECLRRMEEDDRRLARRVEDLRAEQRRNLGGASQSCELPCG